MKALVSLLLLALVAGCTAIDPEARRQSEIEKQEKRMALLEAKNFVVGDKVDKIVFPKFLDSWGYLDDQAIWLESRPKKYYLVTMTSPCPDLGFTQTIGLKSRDRSYLMELDEIVVERRTARRCQIESIYEMTREKKKEQAAK